MSEEIDLENVKLFFLNGETKNIKSHYFYQNK